jgi:hypothetical protein
VIHIPRKYDFSAAISLTLSRGDPNAALRVRLLDTDVGHDEAGFLAATRRIRSIRRADPSLPGEIASEGGVVAKDVVLAMDCFADAGVERVRFEGVPPFSWAAERLRERLEGLGPDERAARLVEEFRTSEAPPFFDIVAMLAECGPSGARGLAEMLEAEAKGGALFEDVIVDALLSIRPRHHPDVISGLVKALWLFGREKKVKKALLSIGAPAVPALALAYDECDPGP